VVIIHIPAMVSHLDVVVGVRPERFLKSVLEKPAKCQPVHCVNILYATSDNVLI